MAPNLIRWHPVFHKRLGTEHLGSGLVMMHTH